MTSNAREQALKADLVAQDKEAPPFVSIERFFDGNDDEGSIGCNLLEHPGLDAFRDALVGLLQRADVESVYAQIAEIDPGAGLWPFTDTIFVAGSIAPQELASLLATLQPDEVASAEGVSVPPGIRKAHSSPVLYAWWD
jgi:hypothetical protein